MAFQALNHSAPIIPQEILDAFSEQPKLKDQISGFISQNPYSTPIFQNISAYVLSLKRSLTAPQDASLTIQASKKRKLEPTTGASAANGSFAWTDQSVRATHSILDISFSIPVRKKMRLEWVAGGLRAVNAEGEVEFGVAWQDIDQAFCLPVPEKAKRQHNFVIIPHGGDGLSAPAPGGVAPEAIVWTVAETGPKDEVAEPEPALTTRLLNEHLSVHGKSVSYPSESEFASAIPPTGRPGERSYHVKAHRGSKDGFLFFLSQGVLWAFKKPLLFLPFSAITSISYTSVLQRTFNLNVVASPSEGNELEIEFSMIDQADYAGIDDYVKKHGLHDASLAASRKAKVYNVNKTADNTNGASELAEAACEVDHEQEEEEGSEEGETELQRAERMLQDEEDELEEDYVEDEEGSEEGSSEDEGWEGDNIHGNNAVGEEEEEEYDEE